MSSWYIFSALGFYPLALASGNYVIGSPLYDQAIVHHGSSTLTIQAQGNTKATPYVSGMKLDGADQDSVQLKQTALSGNHTLTFAMSSSATSWGSTANSAAIRTPLVDTTSQSGSALVSSDGVDASAAIDDNSRTAVTLSGDHADLDWSNSTGPVSVTRYTLTNAASGSAPSAWQLLGSNDGTTWTTLDSRSEQSFTWATQTRSFGIADPGLYQRYRLRITGTADGGAARIAEFELLADPTSQGDLAIHAAKAKAKTGVEFSGGYAVVRGGSDDLSAYQASVDYLDGKGPQAATLSAAGGLGGVSVSLPHTFAAAGSYPVVIAVSTTVGGQAVSLGVTGKVAVTTSHTLVDAYDFACLTTPGTAADCDANGSSLSKTALAAQGFVQGTRVTVPGTDLSFSLPTVADGKPDNASASGQVLPLAVGSDATKLSFIGFANEGTQTGTATINYANGATQDAVIAFGDWVGAAGSPISGNTVVAKVAGRLVGSSGSDNKTTAIFSTTPLTLNQNSIPVSVTLPNLGKTLKQGQLHVFAVADNGTAVTSPGLVVTAASVDQQVVGKNVSLDLATIADAQGGTSATVYWGDNTATSTADVRRGTVSASHSYAVAGDYTAVVTVDDGVTSPSVEVPISVVAPYQPRLELNDATITAGTRVTVTGTGFRANEKVDVSLSTNPVITAEVTANGSGDIQAALQVPKRTMTGTFVVSATGQRSAATATADVVVKVERDATTTTLSAPATARYGEPVTLTATVTGGAIGAVEFRDGNTSLGLAALSGGKATLMVDSFAAGSHRLRATFEGDDWNAGSTSAVATVDISRTAVTLGAPTLSATKAVWGSSGAVLTTRVSGLSSGSVRFVSGKTVLAVATVGATADGVQARGALLPTVPAGTYRGIQAVWDGDQNHASATSASSAATLSVGKATVTSIKASGSPFKKGSAPVVVVKVGPLTNGRQPVGTVKVFVKAGKSKTVQLTGQQAGVVSVTLAKSRKSVTVWATFTPGDRGNVESATSKRVKVTAR
jgi:hypothetical protein